MKYVELNPVGNFDTWQISKLEELNDSHISTSLGQDLLFENDEYRLWVICLYPGERLPFRMQNTNYSWTCLTGGLVVSRFADGSINFFKIEKEDTVIEHQYIADLISKMSFEKVYLIGKNFYKTRTSYQKFKSFDDLEKNLKKNTVEKSTVLIKGSRGMALERILDLL